MPDCVSPFPDRITLNGADYFCLQLDSLMWKSCGKRNVCTFVVTLPKQLTLEELNNKLCNRPAYAWICRLRIKRALPFGLTKWKHNPKLELPSINEYQVESRDSSLAHLISASLDITKQSAFKIDIVRITGAGSLLVFTWHHALMDARGGEMFVRYLGSSVLGKQLDWIVNSDSKLPLRVQANIASDMKQFLYDTSRLPLLTLYTKSDVKPQADYRVLTFTTSQSQIITERAKQIGVGFLISAFYLAVTAYAVAQVHKQRGLLKGDVLVPVPLDRRKRGAQGSIVGNQVSFLFYRIPSLLLDDVRACTAELTNQMKNLMRTESPAHYIVMMDFLRRMPGFLYRKMLKAPTKGLMASFFYSDTGDSLQDFDVLFEQPVDSATHYPPNMYPPGLTFVFSRFRGALQLTVGYMKADLNAAEADSLLTSLSNALLGETGG